MPDTFLYKFMLTITTPHHWGFHLLSWKLASAVWQRLSGVMRQGEVSGSVKVKSLRRVRLFVIPWTAYQAPLSMGFSRQECWSGLPFPSPGDLPDPGIEPGSPALQAVALPSEPPEKSGGSETPLN